ncbi:Golgin subfamily A member 7/ERF4 family-domain-containing protein [Xylaria arbuscula]|nr:Golgin subfamily A member 7/ERF4 family-domain-containing protein [Xylaria arbuscula]
MPVLEDPIPACMNSANLFLSSPLSASIFRRDLRSTPSPRNGPSHHDESTTRLLRSPGSRIRGLSSGADEIPVFPTASHATIRPEKYPSAALRDKAGVVVSSQQIDHPANIDSSFSHPVEPTIGLSRSPPHRPRNYTHHNPQRSRPSRSNRLLPPPFRNQAALSESEDRLPRSLGPPGRLWNPTNSTPRAPPAVYTRSTRKRRPSTPLPPAIPVNHPALGNTRIADDQVATGAGDYPLLTLPEQRQSRHPTPTRSSFQIEERLNEGKRISLPSSVQYSYDTRRPPDASFEVDLESGLPELNPRGSSIVRSFRKTNQSVTERGPARAVSFGLAHPQNTDQPVRRIDKGKGKAVMTSATEENPPRGLSTDLERGPAALGQQPGRPSNVSLPGGIGSAISSSNSSIVGDPDQPGLGDEWGPQHPCFPHLNPYVPVDSAEYNTTRIIRIRRDWLIAGDLAPAFSNMYPEILDPAGISEREFRRVIEKLNGSLIPTFNPYNWRNVLDGVLGVLTAWLWEDLGLTNAKTKLKELETWIEKWNAEMEKTIGSEEGAVAPKIISLRRTGYMSLDFQIPNPEVSVSTSEPGSRSGPAPTEFVASAAA